MIWKEKEDRVRNLVLSGEMPIEELYSIFENRVKCVYIGKDKIAAVINNYNKIEESNVLDRVNFMLREFFERDFGVVFSRYGRG